MYRCCRVGLSEDEVQLVVEFAGAADDLRVLRDARQVGLAAVGIEPRGEMTREFPSARKILGVLYRPLETI